MVTETLQFCRIQKINGKDRPFSQCAVYLNRSIMFFYNRFCQRQSQTNSFDIL